MDCTAIALAELHAAIQALADAVNTGGRPTIAEPLRRAKEAIREIESGRHAQHGPPLPQW